MPSRPLAWLDVFTSTPLTGNGLAVVGEADDLDDETMLAFARETQLSETAFVQSATEEGADYRNRIWTTIGELDFAGHPSLGTAVAVALWRDEAKASYVQQTRAGMQPVDVQVDGDLARVTMLQNPAEFGDEVDGEAVRRASGLRCLHPELPAQVVSTGQAHLLAPMTELVGAHADAAVLSTLLDETGCTVLYCFTVDVQNGTACARGLWMDREGAREDPATGSAAGPLMAYLQQRCGMTSVAIDQGVEMGRPSRLDCAVEGDRVRVGGEVVVLARGRLSI